jgi:hypothetical protein
MTVQQTIEEIRVGQGQRTAGSEVEKALYQDIAELKAMVNVLMNVVAEVRNADYSHQITALTEKVDSISLVADTVAPLQSSLDNLRAASLAMAAKVDATATPATTFVDDFNALL